MANIKFDAANAFNGTWIEVQNGKTVYATSAVANPIIHGPAETQKSTGKWYWETRFPRIQVNTEAGRVTGTGIMDVNEGSTPSTFVIGSNITSVAISLDQEIKTNNTVFQAQSTRFDLSDVISHYLDLDNGTYSIAINGGSRLTITTSLPDNTTYVPVAYGRGPYINFNVVSFEMYYQIPNGYETFTDTLDAVQINPASQQGGNVTLTNNNLSATGPSGSSFGTINASETSFKHNGKWYWETYHHTNANPVNEGTYTGYRLGTYPTGQSIGNHLGTGSQGSVGVKQAGTVAYLGDTGGGAKGGAGLIHAAGDTVRHLIEYQRYAAIWKYSVAVNDGEWVHVRSVDDGYITNVVPAASLNNDDQITFRFAADDLAYDTGGGKTFTGEFVYPSYFVGNTTLTDPANSPNGIPEYYTPEGFLPFNDKITTTSNKVVTYRGVAIPMRNAYTQRITRGPVNSRSMDSWNVVYGGLRSLQADHIIEFLEKVGNWETFEAVMPDALGVSKKYRLVSTYVHSQIHPENQVISFDIVQEE